MLFFLDFLKGFAINPDAKNPELPANKNPVF